VQKRAAEELGTSLSYRRIDVRDVEALNATVAEIADTHGRMDGLVAAAGIQQETPALEYTAKDCDTMMSVNVTGCFMTAQAVAKQMIRFGNGGSMVLIASMSASIANKVSFASPVFLHHFSFLVRVSTGREIRLLNAQQRVSSAPPTTPPKPQCCS
jgi:NADP-dependent 3-hydroxy acid dehydrogenase YdfG